MWGKKMNRNFVATVLTAIAALSAGTSPASMEGGGYVYVSRGGDPFTFGESGPSFHRIETRSNALNGFDGKAASVIRMDFTGGVFALRGHACAGPMVPSSSQVTDGNAMVRTSGEWFDVVSPTLSQGTSVSIRFCLETSVTIRGAKEGTLSAGSASANLRWALWSDGNLRYNEGGQLSRRENYTSWASTGMFSPFEPPSGVVATTFTIAREVTVNTRIGGRVSFTVDSEVFTSCDIHFSNQGSIGDGTAGMATTVGITAITEGANLSHVGADNWLGRCGGSLELIPPNPVPEPSTLLFGLAGTGLLIWRGTRKS